MISVYDEVFVPRGTVGTCIGKAMDSRKRWWCVVEADDGGRVVTVLEEKLRPQPIQKLCETCRHPWVHHEQPDPRGGPDHVDCTAYMGMGDTCGCLRPVPEVVKLSQAGVSSGSGT